MQVPVTYSVDGDIALIRIENPPVNALGYEVRRCIIAALDRASATSSVRAIVLSGSGRTFSAGADITEFGKLSNEFSFSELNRRCETLAKPIVAAIHGWALGGGFEMALSCHARVASSEAQLGLPEVNLGLIPGAGGTQRLPRLIGPLAALELIVTGKQIGALNAAKMGIVDLIVDENLLDEAKAYARALADGGKTLLALRDRDEKIAEVRSDPSGFDAHAKELTKRARGLDAPLACVKAVRIALDTPFDEALHKERAIFDELMSGVQSKSQRHLFFAEREAAKVAGLGKDVKPRDVRKVAVVGAGTMGGGIAMSFLKGGIPVTLLEMNQEALERGLGVIRKNYDISVARGSLTTQARDQRFARLSGTTRYEDLAEADIIIEAVFEDMLVKKEVFVKLDRVAKKGAILASNTSYLDINEVAAVTSRPADVLGLHFFSPANVMRLLEIVRGDQTTPDVLATAITVAKRIAKVPVVVGVCHGFVGNRMLAARSTENENLLLEGAMPETVDKVFSDFGFPMGPFAMLDLAGLDIGWHMRKSRSDKISIVDTLCEAGRFGQKTSKGFYLYEAGSRTPMADPWISLLIEEKSCQSGISRREIPAQEIVERTIYPMINEGARLLEEGIAARPSDIDLVWVNGYGFPIGKGGPMFWADHVGLAKILERLEYWHRRTRKAVFEPAALLKSLVRSGDSFAALQLKLQTVP
ncbi:3-hydroxyacyl-CoA dehydrogenase [Bradyrhizobium sp. USDA 3311]